MLGNFYYNNLDIRERDAYNVLKGALAAKRGECVLTVDERSAKRVWSAVVLDNPDFIYYDGLFSVPASSGNRVRFQLRYSDVDQVGYNRKLNNILNEINSKLTDRSSDYLVCKTIFDVLAKSVKYQYDVWTQYEKLDIENRSQAEKAAFVIDNSSAFTPYGAVMNSKGVCQGIAKLFKILCDRFRIECACIEAKTKDSEANSKPNHMLNLVELDRNIRAFVDVTNGLVLPEVPIVRYDYFLVSTRILNKAYVVSDDIETCTDETVNYFAKNNLRFRSMESLRRYLASYTCDSSNSEVRVFYDGNKLNDNELMKFCSDILNAHCPTGRYAKVIGKNGFCNGIIVNKREI